MREIVWVWLLLVNVAVAQQPAQQTATNSAATNPVAFSLGSKPRESHTVPAADPNSQRFRPVTFKDWMAVLQSLAVIAASFVAFYGINSWRRELVGKRRIELAEEVLALFYQAKDIIAFMRFPVGYSDESSSRKADPRETPEQKRIRDDAFVTLERFNKHSDVFGRIHALRYRFMAQFGRDAVAPFDELKSITDQLFVAARQWVMLSEVGERTFSSPQSLQEHRARIEKCDGVLWGMEKDDPISLRVEKAITTVEQICRPHIDLRVGRVTPCARFTATT